MNKLKVVISRTLVARTLLTAAVTCLSICNGSAQTAPSISAQPVGTNAFIGMNIALQVKATGTLPLTYQWQFGGSNIAGATSKTLSIPFVHLADKGQYRVIVSNAVGSVTSSNAFLNVVGPLVEWGFGNAMATLPPPQSTNIASIAAGVWGNNFFAVRTDGTVAAWGFNQRGQTNLPPGLANVVAVSTAGRHCLALRSDGTVAAWGENILGPCNVPPGLNGVIAVAAGGSINALEGGFSLALKADGTVVDWGYNPDPVVPPGLSNVVAIAAGPNHALFLKSDGTVAAAGNDLLGQVTVPPGLSNIVQVAAGGWSSLALRSDGKVFAWGMDYYGKTNIPASASNIVAIAAGFYQQLALREDGTVVGWGGYNSGQEIPPPGLTNVVAIAGTLDYSMALVSDLVRPSNLSHFSQSVAAGETATFTTFTVGQGPFSYQWQFNGTNIAGATNANLSVTNVLRPNLGIYQCFVTNALGAYSTSPAELTLVPPWFDISHSNMGFATGGFGLTLKGLSSQGNIIVSQSTNLVDWTPMLTNPPVLGTLQILDPTATNTPTKFYRAIEQR